MKYLYLPLIIFALISCGGEASDDAGTSAQASAAVLADGAGKTPNDYIVDYYKAINADDYDALQQMCTKGYHNSIVTKRGYLKIADPSLFKKSFERKMFKNDSFTITPKRSGFHKNNAEGVYSVGTKVIFTADYKPVFEKLNGFKSEHINDEVCFKLEENAWKVTDKLEGY